MRLDRWGHVDIPARVAERAATRWEPHGLCMISTYSTMSTGYAQIGWYDNGVPGRTLAHRAAWVHHNGQQVPRGQTIDHTCKNRRCVNPAHLRVLPNLENARRTSGTDWPLGTCRHGHGPEHWHPKSATNKKGYCRACRNTLRQRRRAAGKRS